MPSRLWQVAHRYHGCMPSVTMISAYAKETADPATINATHARQATCPEIGLGIERPSMMAVSVVACVVTAPDRSRNVDLFSANQAQNDLDVTVYGLRPPWTDQHEVQAGRREFDPSIRGNPHFVNRLHRAQAVLHDRPVKLDSLVVGALDADDDPIGRAAIDDRHIG